MAAFSKFFKGKPLRLIIGVGSILIVSDVVYSIWKIISERSTSSQAEEKCEESTLLPKEDDEKQSNIIQKVPKKRWFRRLSRTTSFWNLPDQELWNTVMFFPEIFPEKPGSQTRQMMWYMEQAKKTVKIAIYSVNFRLLEQVLFALVKKQVRVKAVTNTPRVLRQWRKNGKESFTLNK